MTKTGKQWAVTGIPDHPLRETLTNEIHARPSVALQAPARLSHVAMACGEALAPRDREHVAELCRRFGAPEPPSNSHFWHVDLGAFRLNWERHTEFSTYTFFHVHPFEEPFRDPPIALAPRDWLKNLNGDLLVAIHLALEPRDSPLRDPAQLNALFASDNIAASDVSGGCGRVWTDFRLHGDGFTRILVRDDSLGLRQAGRLAQRLLEIETYRMMALLAFPLAQDYAAKVTEADRKLSAIASQMTSCNDLESERQLFGRLSVLAAEVERLAATSNYRFSAARAYYALVQRRIMELREVRIEGRPTIGDVMERRLAPAMRTCESVHERIEVLSQRVARAGDLLRTRVDLALEQQNRDLLASMNRRAKLQLRLQQTVEGLSVVVLSYYALSLLSYALKGLKAAGWTINVDILSGLALPVVVGCVWFGMRRFHHRLTHKDSQ